jgi:predicted aminopeptidase
MGQNQMIMSKPKRAIIAFLVVAVALLLAFCALFSGCYTLKQGTAMLGYLNRAVPLESLLELRALADAADGGAEVALIEAAKIEAEKNRRFVTQVEDIRRFAIEELGMKASRNYTRYVQIERDYLAAVVSASAQDSFSRHQWHFPIVGAVPYKGFFDAKDARKEREKLEKKGLDVWVRGVEAFSTLGWFRDPLYSYMRDYSAGRLANLMIHELLHATVFIRGQVQFNEELAEFVGSEGARLYIESRFGRESEEYQAMLAWEADELAYVAFIQELIAELETLYEGGAGREEKLREKKRIIDGAKERFAAEYESRFSGDNYRGFAELPVNNAYLDLYRLYYEKDNFLSEVYEKTPGDGISKLQGFIGVAASLNNSREGRRDPRKALSGAVSGI